MKITIAISAVGESDDENPTEKITLRKTLEANKELRPKLLETFEAMDEILMARLGLPYHDPNQRTLEDY